MTGKCERVAFAAGSDPKVAEKLDQVLTNEGDRAFIICAFGECEQNRQGRCTIFAVKDVLKMKRTAPCEHYVARSLQGPS